MGYSLCMMADFQNGLISRYILFFGAVFCTEQLLYCFSLYCFLERFFAQNNCK